MTEKAIRRYLVLVESHIVTSERLAALVPAIQRTLDSLATDKVALAHRAFDGSCFFYLVRSALVAAQIRARMTEDPPLYGPGPKNQPPAPLHSKDKILVLEIGADFDTARFPQIIQPWLAHH